MMINHSTLDHHVTNFNMFTSWLTLTLILTKTLTLTITQTLALMIKLTLFIIWSCHVISRDQSSFCPCIQDTLSSRAALGLPAVQPLGRVRRASKGILHTIFAHYLSGKHFNTTSCGVIRNQRSKKREFNIILSAGGHFRKISKFECRVI